MGTTSVGCCSPPHTSRSRLARLMGEIDQRPAKAIEADLARLDNAIIEEAHRRWIAEARCELSRAVKWLRETRHVKRSAVRQFVASCSDCEIENLIIERALYKRQRKQRKVVTSYLRQTESISLEEAHAIVVTFTSTELSETYGEAVTQQRRTKLRRWLRLHRHANARTEVENWLKNLEPGKVFELCQLFQRSFAKNVQPDVVVDPRGVEFPKRNTLVDLAETYFRDVLKRVMKTKGLKKHGAKIVRLLVFRSEGNIHSLEDFRETVEKATGLNQGKADKAIRNAFCAIESAIRDCLKREGN